MRILSVSLCIAALAMGVVAEVNAAPAYWVAEFEILDAAKLKEFGAASNSIVAKFGGVFLSRRNKPEVAIGSAPGSVTIIQFENIEKAQTYMNSPELKAIAPLRDQAGKFRAYIVPGGDGF